VQIAVGVTLNDMLKQGRFLQATGLPFRVTVTIELLSFCHIIYPQDGLNLVRGGLIIITKRNCGSGEKQCHYKSSLHKILFGRR
jgi:hypothetical protein